MTPRDSESVLDRLEAAERKGFYGNVSVQRDHLRSLLELARAAEKLQERVEKRGGYGGAQRHLFDVLAPLTTPSEQKEET